MSLVHYFIFRFYMYCVCCCRNILFVCLLELLIKFLYTSLLRKSFVELCIGIKASIKGVVDDVASILKNKENDG